MDNTDTKSKQTTDNEIDPVCPGCKVLVEEDGVVCEECKAYWHYVCANTDEGKVHQLGDEDFLCEKHKQESYKQKYEEIRLQMSSMKETLNSQVEKYKFEAQDWKEKFEERYDSVVQKKNSQKTDLQRKESAIDELRREGGV